MLTDLPWFNGFLPGQEDAVNAIVDAFHQGHKIVMLEAPTGSGKTLIAEAVRQQLGHASGLYLCTTKSLQEQFMKSFAYASLIKGRSNYPCSGKEDQFPIINTALCTKRSSNDECRFCESLCPYAEAKEEALTSPLVCANTAYALGIWNSYRPAFNNRHLCIVDEADLLESEIMNHAEIRIPNYLLKQMNLRPPAHVTTEAGLRDGRWQAWLSKARDAADQMRRTTPFGTPQQITRRKSLERLCDRLSTKLDESWALVDEGGVVFKPFRVDALAKNVAFQSAHRYLLMSGTLISGEQVAADLGLEEWTLVEMASTFPKPQRPIIYKPVADMSRRAFDASFPLLLDEVRVLLARHSDQRVLVHTVSYNLTKLLQEGLNSPRVVTYLRSSEREQALYEYRQKANAVLLASSFDRGIDLPQDLCRIQIIAKMPFPSIGDRLVSSRLHSYGGGSWYDLQTARSLVQSFGRGMRSADDWVITYVLDRQFSQFWGKAKHLIPAYIRAAIDFSGGIDSHHDVARLLGKG